MEPVSVNPVATTTVVDPLPTLRWGAIFAGWAVAVGIAAVLYLGGAALGLASFHAHDPDGTAKAVGAGTAIWIVFGWVASLLVGGMFASWFDGRDDQMMGAMHGLSVWGLSILATVLVILCGSGHLHHHDRRGEMQGIAMMASGSDLGLDVALLHAQLHAQVRNAGGSSTESAPAAAEGSAPATADGSAPAASGAMTVESRHSAQREEGLDAVAMALVTNHPDQAQALLAAQTGVGDADASRVVQAVEPQAAKVREDLQQAADRAAKHAATASALLLLSALLGMLGAALGGWLGAHHIHRVYHLRVYARSP